MSRSSAFFPRRSTRDTSSAEALLPQYEYNSTHPLRNLSPQPSVSTSPPPSFYRYQNAASAGQRNIRTSPDTTENSVSASEPSPTRTHSTTGISPERTRRTRPKSIQFAAPPPPIVQSVVFAKQQGLRDDRAEAKGKGKGRREGSGDGNGMVGSWMGGRGGGAAIDPLMGLERKERAIQKELQALLDAQSAGLVQGFGGGGDTGTSLDGESEAGSSTPTSLSVLKERQEGRNHGVTPVRQPKKKVLGLRGARRGLLRDMGELVAIKDEENAILELEVAGREEALKRVDGWEGRIESFGLKLKGNAEDGEESREIEELNNEERAVDTEIREMEDRLLQMRARKKWLREKISEGMNRREARLSSYRGALREVESEVKEFLRRPPIGTRITPVSGAEEEGFMALPPHRRTLGMAREFFSLEVDSLKIRKSDIEKEKRALEEGAQLWQDSVSLVMEFEDDLRMQMKNGVAGDGEVLRKQVEKMGIIIKSLEEALAKAEQEGWNLLICAIGAEVEAFREGEGILRGALGMVDVNGCEGKGEKDIDGNREREEERNTLSKLGESRTNDSIEREVADSSEDDGPDPELLVG